MSTHTPAQASALLLMAPEDNCLIARLELKAGATVSIDGHSVTLAHDIHLGHKVARRDLRPGDQVLRYGAIIGKATAATAIPRADGRKGIRNVLVARVANGQQTCSEELGHQEFILTSKQFEPSGPGCIPLKAA